MMRNKTYFFALFSVILFHVIYPNALAGADETAWPTLGWKASTPEEQGLDSEMLADAVDYVLEKKLRIHSLLVIRNGYIVADVSFYPFRQDTKHDVASITKSLTSTLIGIALANGAIGNIHKPVLDFFPDREVKNLDSRKNRMTVEDLLTMTAGLECIDHPNEATLMAMMASPDWIQYMLDLPMQHRPGHTFVYNSGTVHLLSAIVRNATGKSAFEYAQEYLFRPLGISDVIWPMDPQGVSNTGWGGVRMKPHDMAKLGYLYLKNGLWNGKQILPSSWMREATRRQVRLRGGSGYGYLWWINEDNTYNALGRGGQCILIIPEKDLLIVMTGGGLPWATLRFPNRYVLPAVRSGKSLPANPEGLSHLKEATRRAVLGERNGAKDVPPLPETAKNVSGKKYAVEQNHLGVMAFTLTFVDEQEAKIRLDLALDTDRTPEYLLGLDGVPRMSEGRFGISASGLGTWESDNTFALHIDEIGNINRFDVILVFERESVKFSLFEKTGLGGFTVRAGEEEVVAAEAPNKFLNLSRYDRLRVILSPS